MTDDLIFSQDDDFCDPPARMNSIQDTLFEDGLFKPGAMLELDLLMDPGIPSLIDTEDKMLAGGSCLYSQQEGTVQSFPPVFSPFAAAREPTALAAPRTIKADAFAFDFSGVEAAKTATRRNAGDAPSGGGGGDRVSASIAINCGDSGYEAPVGRPGVYSSLPGSLLALSPFMTDPSCSSPVDDSCALSVPSTPNLACLSPKLAGFDLIPYSSSEPGRSLRARGQPRKQDAQDTEIMQRRERNRLAAERCRKRKLETLDMMMSKISEVNNTNAQLAAENQRLQSRVQFLENLLRAVNLE